MSYDGVTTVFYLPASIDLLLRVEAERPEMFGTQVKHRDLLNSPLG
jgi:hypothetical protein